MVPSVTDLDLRFIGTGNAFAPGGLCWNGFMVNGKYLFEAPPQALQSLHHMGAKTNEIEAVIISHHHGDHFLGLPFLLLEWKYALRKTKVRIVGPPGTRELATLIGESVYPGLMNLPYEVIWDEVGAGERFRVGELELCTLAMQHDERLSATLGFAVEVGGKRLGYTGDSALCDSVLHLASEAEVLVSECVTLDEKLPMHMNLAYDMPKVRAAMSPDATLLLTHLGPGITKTELPRTIVAQDFARYRF